MNQAHRPCQRGRSIGAVAVGFLVVVILSLSTDVILHATGIFPPWGEPMAHILFVLAAAYRTVYSVAGSYITAWLAPDRPMGHAMTLGGVGLLFAIAGAAATWNAGPEFGPKWYSVAIAVLALPGGWAGGRLFTARLGAGPA